MTDSAVAAVAPEESKQDENKNVEPEAKGVTDAPVNGDVPENTTDNAAQPPSLDVGRCLILEGLPSVFYDDPVDIFSDSIGHMMSEDFGVSRDSIDVIIRLSKQAEPKNEENACRALVSFKSRVHKHRVFAMKGRVDSSMELIHLEAIPEEVLLMNAAEMGQREDQVKVEAPEAEELEGEDEVMEGEDEGAATEAMPAKSGDEKGEEGETKKKSPFQDEHADLDYELNWDGAPEFQWKLVEKTGDGRRLVIENADYLDIYEPFFYRVLVKAEFVEMTMPGRTLIDFPNAKKFGTITVQFVNDNMIMREAFRHLIYSRCSSSRRLKIYLPQTRFAVKHKALFESRLGRLICTPVAMKQLLLKAEELSLSESIYTLEDAQKTFCEQKVVEVERVEDIHKKIGFLITFATAEDAVFAHAKHRQVNVGEIECRVHLVGVETGYPGTPMQYVTRRERIEMERENKKTQKRKQDDDSKKAPPAKKQKDEKRAQPPKRGGPANGRGAVRGAAPRGGPSTRGGPSPRGGPSRREASRGSFPRSNAPSVQPFRPGYGPRGESIGARGVRGGGRGGSSGGMYRSPISKGPDMDDMIREQRKQIAMQEQLMRQQQIIESLAGRLQDPPSRGYESSRSLFSSSSPYTSPSAFAKNTTYTPSPAYEPLSYETPSPMNAPAAPLPSSRYSDSYSGYSRPAGFGYDPLPKSGSSSYGSSSSYREHRDRRY